MAKSAKNEKAPEQEAPEEEEENTSTDEAGEEGEDNQEAEKEEPKAEAKPVKGKKFVRKPVEHGVFMIENVMHNGKEYVVGQAVPMSLADTFMQEGFAEER